MVVVILLVDKNSFIRERFLDIFHVLDTSLVTLKHELSNVLVWIHLDIVSQIHGPRI
jgi:hypothetical protein